MKTIKIIVMVLSLSVMYQFAAAQNCNGNKVLMSKGPGGGCGCHCQKKCVAPADTLTYLHNGYHFGTCFGNCCWIRAGAETSSNETSITEIYPNPASGLVTIGFNLAEQGEATLQVFDITGRYVTTIAHKVFEGESNEVTWDAGSVNTGIYFLKLQAGESLKTEKLIITK